MAGHADDADVQREVLAAELGADPERPGEFEHLGLHLEVAEGVAAAEEPPISTQRNRRLELEFEAAFDQILEGDEDSKTFAVGYRILDFLAVEADRRDTGFHDLRAELTMLLQGAEDLKEKEDELLRLRNKLEQEQSASKEKDRVQANDSKLIMQLSKKLENLLMDNEDLRDQNDRLNTRLVTVESEKMNVSGRG